MTEILLDSLMPIFVVMALGYLAGWTRDIDNNHLAALNALVMDFALPLSLFVATAFTPRALLLAQWPLLVVLAVSMLVLYALSRSKRWRAPKRRRSCRSARTRPARPRFF
jgi:malonate transporter